MRPQPVPAWSGRATAQARPYMVSDRMILAAQPGAMPPAARLALLGVDVVDPGDGGPGLMLARSWGEGNNEGMLGRAMFSGCIDKERQHLVAGAVLLRIGENPLDGATFAEKLRQARGALPPPRVVAGSATMRARRRVEIHIERRTYRDVPDAAAWGAWPEALAEVRRHLRALRLDAELDLLRAAAEGWHRRARTWLRSVLLPDPCGAAQLRAWKAQLARLEAASLNDPLLAEEDEESAPKRARTAAAAGKHSTT